MHRLEPVLLLQFLVSGLLACGLNLVFGVMRVINLAHAELMLVGAFLAYVLYAWAGIPPLLAFFLVLPALFSAGFYLQRLVVERVVGKGELQSLLLTCGLSIVLIKPACGYSPPISRRSRNSRVP